MPYTFLDSYIFNVWHICLCFLYIHFFLLTHLKLSCKHEDVLLKVFKYHLRTRICLYINNVKKPDFDVLTSNLDYSSCHGTILYSFISFSTENWIKDHVCIYLSHFFSCYNLSIITPCFISCHCFVQLFCSLSQFRFVILFPTDNILVNVQQEYLLHKLWLILRVLSQEAHNGSVSFYW